MRHDGKLVIATGMSASSRIWKNKKMAWSKFVEKLAKPKHTNETLKEFLAATKDEQGKIKDVGGYVGGYLRNGRRKPENVVHRQLITLDLDFATAEVWDDLTLFYENAAILHGTHKHCEENPKFRLIMPLSREVTPDEYEAIARKIAGDIGINLFDNTGFQPYRLMFWQSTPADQEYYFEYQDGEWLDADEILNSYIDWKDTSLWPTSSFVDKHVGETIKKQQDPHGKTGIVGSFCRAYSIQSAIETFIPDAYREEKDGRYTYLNGSTANGAVVYDDKFLYSHHGTDPSSGQLCNAFDLVRLHKFGHEDEGQRSETTVRNSQKLMEVFAQNDGKVKKEIARELQDNIQGDFGEIIAENKKAETEKVDENWAEAMEVSKKGEPHSTANNIDLILKNDPILRKAFRLNKFDGKVYAFKKMPWDGAEKGEPIMDVDFSGVRNYFETKYKITGIGKIDDSLSISFHRCKFHPIKEYLDGLVWDGERRVNSLYSDYLGAERNIYTEEAARKLLCAGVARVFQPGIKYDLVDTVVGEQGIGKSTLFRRLGKEWFSDSFCTVVGKEAFEQIQGAWIVEMAELSGLRKAEVDATKHYVSKQEDSFRPAYARTTQVFKRQCVFVASTNNRNFLKDATGNRRFIPIDTDVTKATKDVFSIPESEIDQLWAEAVQLWKRGEKLYMSKEAERFAKTEQEKHSEHDERKGVIEEFLGKKLPENWDDMDVSTRRLYLYDSSVAEGEKDRRFVCVGEIWAECFEKELKDMDRYKTREINDILKSLPDWEYVNSTKLFKNYGKQRYYRRTQSKDSF